MASNVTAMTKGLAILLLTFFWCRNVYMVKGSSKVGDLCASNATCTSTNGSYCHIISGTNGTCDCIFMYAPDDNNVCKKVFFSPNITMHILNATSGVFSWTPPIPYPGETNYTIMVSRSHGLHYELYTLNGYNKTTVYDSHLLPFDEGFVTPKVVSQRFVYNPPFGPSQTYVTPAIAPGSVSLSILRSFEGYSFRYARCEIINKNGIISYFILSSKRDDQRESTFNISANAKRLGPRSYTYTGWDYLLKVVPEHNYTFSIYAVNTKHEEGPITFLQKYIPPAAPPRPSGQYFWEAKPATYTQIFITFATDFFQNMDNGQIIEYGLIVMNTFKEIQDPLFGNSTAAAYRTYPNWFAASKNDYTPYRVTPLNWDPLKGLNGTPKNISFTVGADGDCTDKPKDSYCNGNVAKMMFFTVKAFACTRGGCTKTEGFHTFKTAGSRSHLALILGLAIPIGILLVVAGLIIAIKVRSKLSNNSSS